MEEKQYNSNSAAEEEITLKELILKLQEYLQEVRQHWKLVVLLPIPFVVFMLYQAITTKDVYPASLTFMVNEDEGGGFGGMGSILGQFGLGGGSSGKYNLDKILELARSRKIIQQVLLEKKDLNGKDDFIANHLIDVYKMQENWAKDNPELKGFLFQHEQVGQFNKQENAILKSLYTKIIGREGVEGLITTGYGKETGIMKIATKTESEALTIALAEVVYDKLSTYYVQKSVEKQKQTYEVVFTKVDSIKQLMDTKEYALANFKDSHRGLWTTKAQLQEMKLSRDVKILNLLYGRALENLEIADFSLKSKTPFVQLIDAPIAPIKPFGKSKIMAIIKGGFFGGFLALTFILGRKIFHDTMEE